MQNIDLSAIAKKRFTINDDENKVLELNTSDMNIVSRYEEGYKKLTETIEKISNSKGKLTTAETIGYLEQMDKDMRETMDYIFDSNVSEMCCPFGNMFDPINGKFRFEYIIESLSVLYDNELREETDKITKRIKSHTQKYEIKSLV